MWDKEKNMSVKDKRREKSIEMHVINPTYIQLLKINILVSSLLYQREILCF